MSLGQKVVSSSLFLISVRFVQRSLGLISTLILARLLVPEDFGIVAISAISIQFATVLSNSGIKQYIPQKDEVNDEDLNTAWTIDLIMKFALWVLLFISAPYIALFYENDEVTLVIQVISVVVFLRALHNPGLHLRRRNLNYSAIFWVLTWQKVISFCFVIVVAFETRSYWAIIIGDIVSEVVGIIVSYMVDGHRPKVMLKKYAEQLHFTKWMFGRGILAFFNSQLDNLMVSKLFSIGDLGAYNVIRGIAVLPATDLITPAVEPLLSSFSRVKNDFDSLRHQLRTSLLVVLILITPTCILLAFYADEFVFVLLGEQWKDHGDLLANLTVLLFAFSVGGMLGHFYIAIGKIRLIVFYNIISLIFVFSMLLLLANESLADFALQRGILGLITTISWMLLALYFAKSGLMSFLLLATTPAILGALAIFSSNYLRLNFESVYVDLLYNSFTFGFSYVVFVVVFYYLYLYRIREWRHLKDIFAQVVLSKILSRIKRIKD